MMTLEERVSSDGFALGWFDYNVVVPFGEKGSPPTMPILYGYVEGT